MRTISGLWQAFRPLAHANIAPPLWLGQAFAYASGTPFSWRMFWLASLFGVLDHAFIVFTNDWADRDTDGSNLTFNRFSGGSRVLPEGKLDASVLARAAWLTLMLLIGLTLWLVAREQRPWMAWLTLSGVVLVVSYCLPPLALAYRGHGEGLQALGIGVVLPLAGFYMQAGHLALSPLLLLTGFGLGYASNITTALPDHPNDHDVGKRSYVVRKGELVSRRDSLLWIAGAGLSVLASPLPAAWWQRAIVPAVCIALLALNVPRLATADARNHQACERFVWTNGAAISATWLAWTALLWWNGV